MFLKSSDMKRNLAFGLEGRNGPEAAAGVWDLGHVLLPELEAAVLPNTPQDLAHERAVPFDLVVPFQPSTRCEKVG